MPWEEPYLGKSEAITGFSAPGALPVTVEHLARFEAGEPFVLA